MAGHLRGYVLAGGESSRMRSPGLPPDKASLVWRGETLLKRTMTLLQSVCGSSKVLCGTESRCTRLQLSGQGIVDRFEGAGPLGGLEAALRDAKRHDATWILIVPVDLPYLTSELLVAFVSSASTRKSSAYCLQGTGLVQPLPALVHVDAEPFIQEALLAGRRKLLPVLSDTAEQLTPSVGMGIIEAADLPGAGDGSRCFWNVNTPDDFRVLQ